MARKTNLAAALPPPEPKEEPKAELVNHERLGHVEWLKVSDLEVNESYQRNIRQRRLTKLIEEFDISLLGTLDVHRVPSGRGGFHNFIYDGQHRWRACLARGLGDQEIPCNVRMFGSQQAAEMFRRLNRDRIPITAYDDYKAGICARDPEMLELQGILEFSGWDVSAHNSKAESRGTAVSITAVATLVEVMRRTNKDVLRVVLKAMKEAWSDKEDVSVGAIIRGVAQFWCVHEEELDPGYDNLKRILANTDPHTLILDARSHKRHRQWSFSSFVAWALMMSYNRNHRRGQLNEHTVARYSSAFAAYRRRHQED